ncbi:ead/Ea22-like family protein [Cronobacter sakazakii]|nr:ead/Ea22-like family protein [Cronobacter sakazakii]
MNTAKLKAAALAATPGPWRRTSTIFNGITCGPFSLTNEKVLANVAEKANAEFIAAANPAAVLELIAALEAAHKRIAELEARERHNERQRVIDGLAAAGEPWEEIQEYMKAWDEARAAGINLETRGEA